MNNIGNSTPSEYYTINDSNRKFYTFDAIYKYIGNTVGDFVVHKHTIEDIKIIQNYDKHATKEQFAKKLLLRLTNTKQCSYKVTYQKEIFDNAILTKINNRNIYAFSSYAIGIISILANTLLEQYPLEKVQIKSQKEVTKPTHSVSFIFPEYFRYMYKALNIKVEAEDLDKISQDLAINIIPSRKQIFICFKDFTTAKYDKHDVNVASMPFQMMMQDLLKNGK